MDYAIIILFNYKWPLGSLVKPAVSVRFLIPGGSYVRLNFDFKSNSTIMAYQIIWVSNFKVK